MLTVNWPEDKIIPILFRCFSQAPSEIFVDMNSFPFLFPKVINRWWFEIKYYSTLMWEESGEISAAKCRFFVIVQYM